MASLAFNRRWYQVLPVDGAVYEDPARAGSVFWNEGKWRTFVEPLLPADRRDRDVFLDIGCNAGLFLHCAGEAGFRRAIGVERSKHYVEQAAIYRQQLPGAAFVVRRATVGEFDPATLPLSDVVLIANAHYYFKIPAFVDLLDALRVRTRHLIVVSAVARRRHGCPAYDLSSVRGYCRDWTETGAVMDVPVDADPARRDGMFSVRFDGVLKSFDVEPLYDTWYKAKIQSKTRKEWRDLAAALPAFLSGEDEEPMIAYLRTHREWLKDADRRAWLVAKRQLHQDLAADGQTRPIYVGARDGGIADGLTRLVSAHVLGWPRIYGRFV